jgi:hypothetical protein
MANPRLQPCIQYTGPNRFALFGAVVTDVEEETGEKNGGKAVKTEVEGENVEKSVLTGESSIGAKGNESKYGGNGVLMAGFSYQKGRNKRKKFVGTNVSRTMSRLTDSTTVNNLTTTIQEKEWERLKSLLTVAKCVRTATKET